MGEHTPLKGKRAGVKVLASLGLLTLSIAFLAVTESGASRAATRRADACLNYLMAARGSGDTMVEVERRVAMFGFKMRSDPYNKKWPKLGLVDLDVSPPWRPGRYKFVQIVFGKDERIDSINIMKMPPKRFWL